MNTTVRNLLDYVNEQALKYDGIRHEIYDVYDLFLNEIEDPSASVADKAKLCIIEIEELIEAYRICGTL